MIFVLLLAASLLWAAAAAISMELLPEAIPGEIQGLVASISVLISSGCLIAALVQLIHLSDDWNLGAFVIVFILELVSLLACAMKANPLPDEEVS
jgi:MFS family permease